MRESRVEVIKVTMMAFMGSLFRDTLANQVENGRPSSLAKAKSCLEAVATMDRFELISIRRINTDIIVAEAADFVEL
jgi:hypothetical protein